MTDKQQYADMTATDRTYGKQAADAHAYAPSNGDKTLAATHNSADTKDHSEVFDGTDDWTVPARVANQRFFVQIDHKNVNGMIEAFEQLDRVMREENIGKLISSKSSHSFGGRTVQVGEIAVLSFRGRPILVTKPGKFWNFSLTHSWLPGPNYDLTQVTQVFGLTYAQVGQSEAMVCLDPANQVFIVRNGGFAAYGSAGQYKVVEIVDTLNLGEKYAVREARGSDEDSTMRILGYKREVTHAVDIGGRKQSITIATFFNVPASNTVVIQNGGYLKALGAGQHVITNPRATFRGFFTLGERQQSFRTQPAYTLEGVPVVLHVNLRYRVVDPILLTTHYENAFQALKNPAQSAVNAVVSRLSYQQFMRARKIQGDIPDHEYTNWLDAFRQECMTDLSVHAIEYGVKVLSFDVLDRRLEGKLGDDLEKQAESVLKNQMQSTQVGLQNKINTETEQGRLEVANVRALQTKTEAEATYLQSAKQADAEYYRSIKDAEAEAATIERLAAARAAANRIETEQKVRAVEQLARANAEAARLEGEGYASVQSEHGRRMQLEQLEREKFARLPEKATLFLSSGAAPGRNPAEQAQENVTGGYSWAQGLSMGRAT